MTFKEFVYKEASKIDPYYKECKPNEEELSVDVLVNAMWAINREGEYKLLQDDPAIYTVTDIDKSIELGYDINNFFFFKDYNNSEKQSLTAALNYIFEQSSKEG